MVTRPWAVYFTALRRCDLLTLTWDEIEPTRIVRRMKKTGNDIVLPLHPVLRAHLAELPRTNAPFVFGHGSSKTQIANELTGMAKVANVPPFLMHSFRRLSGQMWEKARAGLRPMNQRRFVTPLEQPSHRWPVRARVHECSHRVF